MRTALIIIYHDKYNVNPIYFQLFSKIFIKQKTGNKYQFFLTGVEGIEPSSAVLETVILPMNYTPIFFSRVQHA